MARRKQPRQSRSVGSTTSAAITESSSVSIAITQPFDPTQINIIAKQMSLDTLVKRIKHREISLSPDFQRNEVWNLRTKSRLIESLLIRIPLPAFYMDATNEEEWLVVDGLQRLSTLRDFVLEKDQSKRLKLSGLEFLTDLEGYTYDKLPRNYQRRIDETQVTVYQIEKGTPPKVKFNVFKRINTGGMPLSAQEIRHALNQGPATSTLQTLADSNEFLDATSRGIGSKRMADREAVLRCLAFMVLSYKEFTRRDFDEFLTHAMKLLNDMSDRQRLGLCERFLRAMTCAHDLFGENAFRKRESTTTSRAGRLPINKALLETWTVHLGALSLDEMGTLRERKSRLLNADIKLQKDDRFISAISQGTAKPEKVKYRFRKVEELIRRILK